MRSTGGRFLTAVRNEVIVLSFSLHTGSTRGANVPSCTKKPKAGIRRDSNVAVKKGLSDLRRGRILLPFSCSLAKKRIVEPLPQERPEIAHKEMSGRGIGYRCDRKRGPRTYRPRRCSSHSALSICLFLYRFSEPDPILARGLELNCYTRYTKVDE